MKVETEKEENIEVEEVIEVIEEVIEVAKEVTEEIEVAELDQPHQEKERNSAKVNKSTRLLQVKLTKLQKSE